MRNAITASGNNNGYESALTLFLLGLSHISLWVYTKNEHLHRHTALEGMARVFLQRNWHSLHYSKHICISYSVCL